jgi:hypothetical protein
MFNKKIHEVKNLVHSLFRNGPEGNRNESRTIRVLVAIVIPFVDQRPQIDQAFTATTTNYSNTGTAIATTQPQAPNEAILGFRLSSHMVFFRAEVKHTESMGGGFYRHGYQLTEVVSLKDCPELESLQL